MYVFILRMWSTLIPEPERRKGGRPLRRYRSRWKIGRLFAWLQNYLRLTVPWERRLDNFLGTLHFACALILLGYL